MKLSDNYIVDCELEVQVTVNIRVTGEGLDPSWFSVDPVKGTLELTMAGMDWFAKEAKDMIEYGPTDYDIVDYEIPSASDAVWSIFDEDSREVTVADIPLGALEPF